MSTVFKYDMLLLVCYLMPTVSMPTIAPIEEPILNGCVSPQYLQIGEQGVIHCSFPPTLKQVYWYYSSDYSTQQILASYSTKNKEKGGHGYDIGSYDVFEDGSLVINQVTGSHQRKFKAVYFDKNDTYSIFITSVEVYEELRQTHPFIERCRDLLCYEHCTEATELECSFNSARPPVHLEWVKKNSDREQLKNSDPQLSENDDGTYDAILNLQLNHTSNQVSLYVCKFSWILPDGEEETLVIIDSSEDDFFSSMPVLQMFAEVYKRTELRCTDGGFNYNIWKKTNTNGHFETIAIQAMTKKKYIPRRDGMWLSTQGSLIFSSVDLTNEGSYVCLTDKESVRLELIVLIPPSPPYLIIEECIGKKECVIEEYSVSSLKCSLKGVRPSVELTWKFDETLPIKLEKQTELTSEKDGVYDILITTTFEIEKEIYCDQHVIIECLAVGDAAKLFQPSTKVSINSEQICVNNPPPNDLTAQGKLSLKNEIILSLVFAFIITAFLVVFAARECSRMGSVKEKKKQKSDKPQSHCKIRGALLKTPSDDEITQLNTDIVDDE